MSKLFPETGGYYIKPTCALQKVVIKPKWWQRLFLRRKETVVDLTQPLISLCRMMEETSGITEAMK